MAFFVLVVLVVVLEVFVVDDDADDKRSLLGASFRRVGLLSFAFFKSGAWYRTSTSTTYSTIE